MTICANPGHLRPRNLVLVLLCFVAMVPHAFTQRVLLTTPGSRPLIPTEAVDLGPAPESQILNLEVRLKPLPARAAALDQLIAAQSQPGSASYRKWLNPDEFAALFGATDAQIASTAAWVESQGLDVGRVSAGRTRIFVSGSVAQVQAAFGVQLRRYSRQGVEYSANSNSPSVPKSIAGLIAGVSGLDSNPPVTTTSVETLSPRGIKIPLGEASTVSALDILEDAIDANVNSILLLSTAACSAEVSAADHEAYRAALLQAEAQGITALATSECTSAAAGSFPASLAELAAVAPQAPAATERSGHFDGTAARPAWQFADGLPEDGFREEPDLSADILTLGQTFVKIQRQAGTRLGNVAPVLYELAKTPKLFTQPDGAATGTWERATGLGIVDLTVLEAVFPRGSIGTSSLLAAVNYAPVHGHNLTLTATVTSTGGSGIPTGTVTFTSTQNGTLGTATLDATGVATFSSSTLPGGTYTLTSVYSGDATYIGSTSGVATVTVVGEVSVITATVEQGAVVGGNAAIDVSVTSGSGVGTPSGTVTVAPQGTDSASASTTISGTNGTATGTVLLPVFQAGQFTLLISCTDPDASFTCYSPLSIEMIVDKGASSTTITASPDSPAAGDSYTLTATVAASAASASARHGSGSLANTRSLGVTKKFTMRAAGTGLHALDTTAAPAPTGSVQFLDGTVVLGTQSIDSGTATFSSTATSATHSFSAVYSGDQNYQSSNSSTPTTTTGGLPTSTSLTASTYVAIVGQTVTFYSTVFSVGVASTMTGTVTYTAATQGVLGTGTVSGGLATLTLNSLPAGIYNLSATYSGDATFASSTSTTTVILTVTGSGATLAGSITPSPVPYGSDATLVATATFPTGVVGGPLGTLQAVITGVAGATYTQTLVPSATGPGSKATFTFAAPVPGKYSVVVSCTTADTFACGAPVTIPLTVVQGGTQTVLTLNPAAPFAGQRTTLTATIVNTGNDPGPYVFSGSVQFYVNGKLAGSSLVTGGAASLSVGLPASSADSIYAVYSGDTNWKASMSAPLAIPVSALASSIALTSNVSSVIAGVQVVLTATVTSASTTFIPTTAPSGLVDFFDTYGGTLSKLGSSTLASLGANTSIATFNAIGLQAGPHTLYAVYEGDSVYLGATSPTLTLGLTNFAITFVPATMTLTRGQRGQATLVVNYTGGFNGTVSFGCVPPANVEVTCAFTPSVLSQAGTTTLNVSTVAPSAASGGEHAGIRHGEGLFGRLAGGSVLALLICCINPRRVTLLRRDGRLGLLLLLMAIAAAGVTGCSGTHLTGTPPDPTAPTDPGSALGTQILTITTAGSDGTNTVRHDFQYQVTVE